MAEYMKPIPQADVDSQEFWDACARHELIMRRCKNCRNYHYPPSAICPVCFSMDLEWDRVSGKGEVYTYTIVRRPAGPDWEDAVPYVIAVVRLEEGVKMVTNIVDCAPEDVTIGMKVEVTFDDVTDKVSLPKFKPAS